MFDGEQIGALDSSVAYTNPTSLSQYVIYGKLRYLAGRKIWPVCAVAIHSAFRNLEFLKLSWPKYEAPSPVPIRATFDSSYNVIWIIYLLWLFFKRATQEAVQKAVQ